MHWPLPQRHNADDELRVMMDDTLRQRWRDGSDVDMMHVGGAICRTTTVILLGWPLLLFNSHRASGGRLTIVVGTDLPLL